MVKVLVWSGLEAGDHKLIKIKFIENYKNMDHAFRARWSGQGCKNKLIIISIVMNVPQQSRIVGEGIFEI